MKKEITFKWYPQDGLCICRIKDKKGNEFFGDAACHEDDSDMMSEKTGNEIAYRRAVIQALCYYRDTELKPKVDALTYFYHCIDHGKNFNPKSYETKMLYKQLDIARDDLQEMRDMIKTQRTELKNYIDAKENFYQQIRKNRKAKILEEEHNKNQDIVESDN